jgi:FkbM family methyltransferase
MFVNFRIFIVSYLTYLIDLITFYPKLKKTILLNLGHPPKVVLDVGGNKGQSISYFLKLNENTKIISFEPTRSLYKYLIRKYNSFPNITISNKGISSFSGKKKFYENRLNLTSSFEKLNYDSDYLKFKTKILGIDKNDIIKEGYNVNVITLSSYINDNISSDIDVIKIDVEGHEYECLRGLFNTSLDSNIHLIQLEYHNDDMYKNSISFNQINDILNKNNFELIERFKHAFGEFEDLLYKNKII